MASYFTHSTLVMALHQHASASRHRLSSALLQKCAQIFLIMIFCVVVKVFDVAAMLCTQMQYYFN